MGDFIKKPKRTLKNILPNSLWNSLSNLKGNLFIRHNSNSRKNFLKILPKNSICAEIGVFIGTYTKDI